MERRRQRVNRTGIREDLEEGMLPEPPGSWLVAWMQRFWSVRLGKEGHRWGQRKM